MRKRGQNGITRLFGMGEVARYKDNRNAGWPDGYDGHYPLSRRHRPGKPGIDYRYRPGRPGIDYPIAPNIWPYGRPNGAPQTCHCGWHVSHCKCNKINGRMVMPPGRPPYMVPDPHHPPAWAHGMYDPGYDPRYGPQYYVPPQRARPPRRGWRHQYDPHYDPYYDDDDTDDDIDDDCSWCPSVYHPGGHYPIHEDDVSSIVSIHSYERQRPTHYHGGHHGHRHGGHGMHSHHYPTHPPPRNFYGSGRRGHPKVIQYPHDHRSITETEETW